MPIDLLLPPPSPTTEFAAIAKWLKQPGDRIAIGEVIAEIETDKATIDVEAVVEGTLTSILVPAGTANVPVNSVIATVTADSEATNTVNRTEPPAKNEIARRKDVLTVMADLSFSDAIKTRVLASPLARRLARDAGVVMTDIKGSGPGGRVLARDVTAAAQGFSAPLALGADSSGRNAPAAMPVPDVEPLAWNFPAGSYDLIDHRPEEIAVARRLAAPETLVPSFHLRVECDATRLSDLVERLAAAAPAVQEGSVSGITSEDLLMKIVAMALTQVPAANATWTNRAMLRHRHANVAMISLQADSRTVLREAERSTLTSISRQRAAFGHQRSPETLTADADGGGVAAVAFAPAGIDEMSLPVRTPQSMTFVFGAVRQEQAIGDGVVATRRRMTVTLTCDHRSVDGSAGAELLGAVRSMIENPLSALV